MGYIPSGADPPDKGAILFILVVIWTDVKGEQVKRSCQIFARWYTAF